MRPCPPRSRDRLLAALCLTLSTLSVLSATGVRGQDRNPSTATAADPGINKQFLTPDVKALIQRLETESREVYARRESVVDALKLKPGMAVADVGAGTGLFTRLMAARVGPGGKVYAVDISEPLLSYIDRQSREAGQRQVSTVKASQDSTGLARGSIDLAFLCDTYHHFEKPRETLASIRDALRPDGQLVVVEFDRTKAEPGSFVATHVRADPSVFAAEIRAAGFEPVPVPNPPALKENFLLRFRKSAVAGSGRTGAREIPGS